MPPPPKSDAPAGAPPPPPAAAAKPEKPAPPAAEPAASAPAAASAAGGIKAWIPAVAAIIIAPAVTWGVTQFVLLPQLVKRLNLPVESVAEAGLPQVEKGKDGKPKESENYPFENVVVNLAGTMGTRYLKTSFIVTPDPKTKVDLKQAFVEKHAKLYDTTLNILSSLTLADLEEPGAKNVIREKLVAAYNQVLGSHVADQVYFSEFVVQ
jgi:flagellar FliL protein